MLKSICLIVLLYVVCLSNIVDGSKLNRVATKVSLQKAQNNIRSILSNEIGQKNHCEWGNLYHR